MPRLPGIVVVPNSTPHKCSFCDRTVHVSPAGMPLLEEGVFPACPVCVRANADPGMEPQVTEAVRQEIEDRCGETPEGVMRGIKPDVALSMMADRIISIEGRIERGEISG